MYYIYRNGQRVGGPYKTLRSACRRAEALNAEYGACVHSTRFLP